MAWKVLINNKTGEKNVYSDTEINSDVQTSAGLIRKEELLNAKPGSLIRDFRVLEPTFTDFLTRFEGSSKVVPLKDCALIAAYSGVRVNDKVVDCGTGMGVLACYLGTLVKPGGMVTTYESNKEAARLAVRNVSTAGLDKNVWVVNKDAYKGFKGKDLGLITADLEEPWKLIKHAEVALRWGAYFVSVCKDASTMMRLIRELRKSKKLRVEKTIEVLERGWEVEKNTVLPSSLMLAHSGFLVFARKH